MQNNERRSGFTLIEVLIVVIIMAVLAATIIPQFSSSTKDARNSTLKFNISTMRSQIELYRAQHLGNLPDNTTYANLAQLGYATDVNGAFNAASPAVPDATHPFGPYIDQVPANPFNSLATVVGKSLKGATTAPTPDGSTGWVFDTDSGMIWANNLNTTAN